MSFCNLEESHPQPSARSKKFTHKFSNTCTQGSNWVILRDLGESFKSNLNANDLDKVEGEVLKGDLTNNFTTVCDDAPSDNNKAIDKGQEGREEENLCYI